MMSICGKSMDCMDEIRSRSFRNRVPNTVFEETTLTGTFQSFRLVQILLVELMYSKKHFNHKGIRVYIIY